MENNSRRSALKQLLFFSVGTGLGLESCSKTAPKQDSVVIPNKPLNALRIPADTFPKAADGTIFGDGLGNGPKVRSEHTNGQFCCQEFNMPPKTAGPPPHMHSELDELMRVIEGSVHVLVGETVIELKAGDWHVRPHGIIHTFWNAGDVPARAIDMYLNQDLLSMFDEYVRIENKMKRQGLGMQSPEAATQVDELMKKFGVTMYPEKFPPIIEKYGLKV